jgi:hypothetical protein
MVSVAVSEKVLPLVRARRRLVSVGSCFGEASEVDAFVEDHHWIGRDALAREPGNKSFTVQVDEMNLVEGPHEDFQIQVVAISSAQHAEASPVACCDLQQQTRNLAAVRSVARPFPRASLVQGPLAPEQVVD